MPDKNVHDTWKEEGCELMHRKKTTLQFWSVCLQPCVVCSNSVQNDKMLLASEILKCCCPGFGWVGVNFPSRTFGVLDLVLEEC